MSTEFRFRFLPRVCRALLFLCTALFLGCQGGDDFFERRENAKFAKVVDQYFEDFFKAYPVRATAAGFHQYDSEIGPMNREQIFEERRRLNDSLRALSEVQAKFLTEDNKLDYQILDYHIRGQLIDLDEIGYWARDPSYYDDLITRSIDELIQHDFAPIDDRLRSIVAREKKIPDALKAARDNIKSPPRILAEIAVNQFNASLTYFREFVPKAVEGAQDQALQQEFKTANDEVIRAYQDYLKVTKDAASRARDPFFIGKKNFEQKLLYDELIQISFSDLLQYGEREVKKNQQLLSDKAKEIDAKKDTRTILAELSNERPNPSQLFDMTAQALDHARQFAADRNLLTLPSDGKPKPREMVSFLRPLALVRLDSPGVLEIKAADSYLEVSLPERGWSGKQTDDHMRSYNTNALRLIAIHEGFPGHHVQAWRLRDNPSKVRKILQTGSLSEGWAHYCERMMVDEGFAENDPKVRMEQLRLILLAMARQVVGMRTHSLEMNFEQATEFLMKEAYLDRAPAEREVRQAVRQPLSGLAGLGRLLILQLKDEALKRGLSVKDFHDQFLKDALPPGIHSLGTWSRPELQPQKKR